MWISVFKVFKKCARVGIKEITKFLGLQLDNRINWKNCIEEIIPNLSGICYAVRSMVHISKINTLKSIYYAYFHSIIKYGIIFWGNSSYSGKIFTVQEKIMRLMSGAPTRTSCRSLFKQLEILPDTCHYIFSLINFLINSQEIFQINSSIHNINTRNKHHFLNQIPTCLFFFKKSTFYADKNFQQFTT